MERKEKKQEIGMTSTMVKIMIRERKTRYFGCLKRHDHLMKTMLEGKAEGKRRRGKPRTNWEKNVKNWTEKELQQCTVLSRDRAAWRLQSTSLEMAHDDDDDCYSSLRLFST